MEITSIFFREGIADSVVLENQQLNFNVQNLNSPGPEDEDENEKENNNENEDNKSGNDDPPIDENVVHSPVTTQDGGKPKQK